MSPLETSTQSPLKRAHLFKKGVSPNPGGITKRQRNFTAFLEKPFDDQRKDVDQSWLELAYLLPQKAIGLALIATKKEFGALQQLVTAAAIAKDKRFGTSDDAIAIRIPARLLAGYQVAIVVKAQSDLGSVARADIIDTGSQSVESPVSMQVADVIHKQDES